jgi:protein TonB
VEGRVVLQAEVGSDGRLANVRIKDSSGHRELDQAALQSVRQWVFRPARQGDKPINQQVLIPVEFRVRLAEDESN